MQVKSINNYSSSNYNCNQVIMPKVNFCSKQQLAQFTIRKGFEQKWAKFVQDNPGYLNRWKPECSAKWANLIEQGMSSGAKLEDIAAETYQQAIESTRNRNIPDMQKTLVDTLNTYWETHGSALKTWYNASVSGKAGQVY